MKNLLPILALLLLVGCTSELDRCLEANIDESVPSFNLIWFNLKIVDPRSDFDKCLVENPLGKEYANKTDKLSWERLIANEEGEKELAKEKGKEIERLKDKHYSDLKLLWEICEDTEKRKAEKICHAQGIY